MKPSPMKNILMVCLLVSVVACSSASVPAPNAPAPTMGPSYAPNYAPNAGNSLSFDVNVHKTDTVGYASAEQEASQDTMSLERLTIRTARMSVAAKEAITLYKEIAAFCSSLGGYEQRNSVENGTSYTYVNAVLKVPPQKLAELTSFVESKSRLINSSLSESDITESYYDTEDQTVHQAKIAGAILCITQQSKQRTGDHHGAACYRQHYRGYRGNAGQVESLEQFGCHGYFGA